MTKCLVIDHKQTIPSDQIVFITGNGPHPWTMYEALKSCTQVFVSHENPYYLNIGIKRLDIIRVYYSSKTPLKIVLKALGKLSTEEISDYRVQGWLVVRDKYMLEQDYMDLFLQANLEESVRHQVKIILTLGTKNILLKGREWLLVSDIKTEADAQLIRDKFAKYLNPKSIIYRKHLDAIDLVYSC